MAEDDKKPEDGKTENEGVKFDQTPVANALTTTKEISHIDHTQPPIFDHAKGLCASTVTKDEIDEATQVAAERKPTANVAQL